MARLWTAGAELQTNTAGIEFSAIITTAPAVETTTKRSGAAAWRISNAAAIEGFRQIHTAAQGAFFFRFYLYIVAMPTNTRVIGGSRQTGLGKVVLRLTSGGNLQLYNFEDSAQVGSNSSALSTATWYRIELKYDSTTLASTTCEALIDGSSFASGTVDIAATPNSFGCFIDAADATLDYIVDDLAINDASGSFQNSWPGEGEVIYLRPNGNGDNSNWGGSDGNSTDNYLLINETPPDTANYVEDNTLNEIDDYNLEATPAAMASNDTINVVHVGVYAAVNDATASDPDIVLRIKASAAGTVEESAALDVNSVTYQGPAPLPADSNYKLTLYDLPGGSTTAWTKADLDQAQAGVRVSTSDTHFARVAALWVVVDHKPSAGGTEYTQSASGAITPSGATLKAPAKIVSGAVTPTGALLKAAAKVLAGSLTPSGALAKLTSKTFAGGITPSGEVSAIRTILKSIEGAITPTGALLKSTAKTLAGALTPSGALSKIAAKLFAGSITPSGTATKQTNKSAAGSVTPSGAENNETQKGLAGSITPAGTISRSINKVVAGTLTAAGTISKAISKFVAGVLSLAGIGVGEETGPEEPITGVGMAEVIYSERLRTIRAEAVETIDAQENRTIYGR